MEPKLVYRCLRQLSVWVTDNYYSEVVVEGAENVPKTGPVILAATHRNESIDVAVLAVTIPHGRQVSYWAKSSLFKQPILRWIMESSGAIPVQRGGESASASITTHSSSNTDNNRAASQTQGDLFRASTACLMCGGTLGVFPEGFSATLPGLGDLRSGAAWAAVEHDRAARPAALERGVAWESARIVPVSIVYTDTPAYQSQVLVRYGPAIKTADYYSTNAGEDDLEGRKEAAARMMDAVRHTLQADGINAPDWPTLHAAKVMLDFDYSDPVRKLGVRGWVLKMQGCIQYLSDDENNVAKDVDNEASDADNKIVVDNEKKQAAKAILARYHALQIHTQISHADLLSLVPPNHSLAMRGPFLVSALLAFLQASARTVLCLPALVVYLPAYAASYAATAVLTRRDQPESQAQVSAIAGGLGLGLGFWGAFETIKRLYGPAFGRLFQRALRGLTAHADPSLSRYISLFVGSRMGKLAMGYVALKTLMAWHDLFAEGNRRIFRRCVASTNIFLAIMFPGYEETSPVYDAPPVIAENAHARRKGGEGEERRKKEATAEKAREGETMPRNSLQEGDTAGRAAPRSEVRRPWKFTLVGRLLTARREASKARDRLQGDEELWRVIR
ncbi:uncharacterized protein SCHCODRAFT_02642185 [Schizophyllum commune H4-8]|uniref:uncharacterized protein n=1 Tax=Schizophyllum commune (strain H4-8 / FGSC 9210) TaxID=578458 RepID=UPI00215E3596|nr:uncharacterized protein SCHCODRAFT_02642185 [Schizophyllum commune H4-8]KAI5886623.1 hypothetical protein SCHCODRAFT_02642185 [Schizophyllum commune H4-8]